jgi:hypothetical protein
MKRKKRKLKAAQQETLALLEYLLAEAFESGSEKHYRLKMPYGHQPDNQVQFIVDISVYFDGELSDESGSKKFRITGPDKASH